MINANNSLPTSNNQPPMAPAGVTNQTSAQATAPAGEGKIPAAGPLTQGTPKKKVFGLDMKALATVLGLTIFFLVGMAAVLITLRTSFGPQDFSPVAPEAPSADVEQVRTCTLTFMVVGDEEESVFACDSECSSDTQCQTIGAGYSCVDINTLDYGDDVVRPAVVDMRCRLTVNPTNTQCLPADEEEEEPTVVDCGDDCNANLICPDDHTCSNGKCVLDECLQDGVNCDAAMCEVIEDEDPDPTATPTPSPTVEPTATPTTTPTSTPTAPPATETTTTPTAPAAPAQQTTTTQVTQEQARANCNQACSVNSDCAISAHICFEGACRLATNPESVDCTLPAGAQPVLPGELPESGATDLSTWLKAGLGILGLGALMLLLL